MGKALIISNQAEIQSVGDLLDAIGHTVITADNVQKGWSTASTQHVDVILLHTHLPDGDGLALLPRLRQLPESPEVIVVTEAGNPKSAEFALRNGAWDYLVAQADVEPAAVSMDQALQYRRDQGAETPPIAVKREKIIGNSPRMKACFDQLGQTACSDANVLIVGETGTGKELFARAIHSNRPRRRPAPGNPMSSSNPRADKNFVVVDCTALPETLVESVLFGHTKGAFTGADQDQEGLIAQAHGGTLFLDEVGELPLRTQKTFLRVLQERRYRPVGSKTEKESHFRLIAATNRDLEQMVDDGAFRKDLLFRLRALVIDLPPLRKRREDIKDLVRYHTRRLCETYAITSKGFSEELLDALSAYSWPGNVRELINTIDGMLAAAGNDHTLYAKHLPLHLRVQVVCNHLADGNAGNDQDPSSPMSEQIPNFKSYREDMERQYLQDLMAATDRNIPKAVEISGISRSRIYEMLAKHNLAEN
jgi:two-component system NtrC family response regulator